jgi:hypothetical protein
LSEKRQFLLVLRLVTNPGLADCHGEVIDPRTGRSHPFSGLAGLGRVIARWLPGDPAFDDGSADDARHGEQGSIKRVGRPVDAQQRSGPDGSGGKEGVR